MSREETCLKLYQTAKEKIGQHEIKGGENPFIIECHATTTLKAREDEIAWCASFVNWDVIQAGLKGTNSAAAASWLDWGVVIDEPIKGCITIIQQKKRGKDKATGSTSGNHVAFFDRIENGHIYLLGGNQSDSVKISGFNLDSYTVRGYRVPKGE